jgi:hypothetical protein
VGRFGTRGGFRDGDRSASAPPTEPAFGRSVRRHLRWLPVNSGHAEAGNHAGAFLHHHDVTAPDQRTVRVLVYQPAPACG